MVLLGESARRTTLCTSFIRRILSNTLLKAPLSLCFSRSSRCALAHFLLSSSKTAQSRFSEIRRDAPISWVQAVSSSRSLSASSDRKNCTSWHLGMCVHISTFDHFRWSLCLNFCLLLDHVCLHALERRKRRRVSKTRIDHSLWESLYLPS